jgi:hypothetical protein
MAQKTFPQLSKGQRTGGIGQTIVAGLVQERLGWLYRQNHQEDDFGIDGYIDIVRDDGDVLGRTIGVQVKTGESHIQAESSQGFKLTGDLKHLNYFLNSPVPIVLILVNKRKKTAWWVHIRPEAIKMTSKGWSILIPKSQQLDESSREVLSNLAGPVIDYRPIVDRINSVRAATGKFDLVMLVISKDEVHARDVSRVVAYFEMFEAAPDQLPNARNKFVLLVHGYDDDKREVYEIPEVREWFNIAEQAVLGWAYYLSLAKEVSTLAIFLACTCDFEMIGSSNDGKMKSLSIPPPQIAKFLERHFNWLNQFTEKHGLSEEINKEVSIAFGKALLSIGKFER